MITAKIIADSESPNGVRITTLSLRYPKFIHGEFMTHRVFSRNASSSRAIPTAKILEEVRSWELMAQPEEWGKNQKGMSASENLEDTELKLAINSWCSAAHKAADEAEEMLKLGVHKQIVNRILEPFTHINVVVTSTEWNNFFGLRLDPGAQPEIRILATKIFAEMQSNKPKLVDYGHWHLPFITVEERLSIPEETLLKVSVARCARVSYLSFDTGKVSTVDEDLVLFERLVGQQPVHASPAEHQATPLRAFATTFSNFKGWYQHRKSIPGEDCAPLPEKFKNLVEV